MELQPVSGEQSSPSAVDLHLPPGFRFHPTDEELVAHYLARRLTSSSFKPVPIITELDLYKYDPWELPQQSTFGDKEWYFFSPRDRKYPNGVRPNRAAASGYWKATGTDKIIHSSTDGRKIGVKKALVFYKGRAPKGVKSNWIMHEYRLVDAANKALCARKKGSLRLDEWVLCRIYKKKAKAYTRAPKQENTRRNIPSLEEDILASLPEIDDQGFPRLAVNDPFMQVLLSGGSTMPGHGRSNYELNPVATIELLRNRQQQTEMLFPSPNNKEMWQFGSMLGQGKEEDQSTTTSLVLLDSLQRQQAHDYQQHNLQFNLEHHHHHQQQHHGEVVDDSTTPVLFPPPQINSSSLNFSNGSFNLHTGAY